MAPTYLTHTFGCKLNFSETATIARMLEERGFTRAAKGEHPDIVVVNTCSVTGEADKKCRQTIRAISRRHPHAAIAVTGCYVQLPPVVDINKASLIRDFAPSCSRGDRTRWFLKVQDGCDYWCTYCTIPKARGRSRSATISQLVSQAEEVASEGGREIVITGVNIGDFGKLTGETFLDLCRALDRIEGIERYRISSIEPDLLTDEIIDFVGASQRFMPHFHLPLQSGSDSVLRLMRRHYDTALFASRVERILKVMPHAFIGVDLITGAMGETRELFDESRRFVESLPVSRLHVFPYSERAGTRALEITPRIEPAVRHERCREMIAVSGAKLAQFQSRHEGTVRKVLVEHSVDSEGRMHGFTDNYIKVEMPADPRLFNAIVDVRLSAGGDDFMKGVTV